MILCWLWASDNLLSPAELPSTSSPVVAVVQTGATLFTEMYKFKQQQKIDAAPPAPAEVDLASIMKEDQTLHSIYRQLLIASMATAVIMRYGLRGAIGCQTVIPFALQLAVLLKMDNTITRSLGTVIAVLTVLGPICLLLHVRVTTFIEERTAQLAQDNATRSHQKAKVA